MAVTAPLLRLSVRSWLAIGFIAILTPDFLLLTLSAADPISPLLRILVVAGATPPSCPALLPGPASAPSASPLGQLIAATRTRPLRAMPPWASPTHRLRRHPHRGGFGNLALAAGPNLILPHGSEIPQAWRSCC